MLVGAPNVALPVELSNTDVVLLGTMGDLTNFLTVAVTEENPAGMVLIVSNCFLIKIEPPLTTRAVIKKPCHS